jgi:hypothetical protein
VVNKACPTAFGFSDGGSLIVPRFDHVGVCPCGQERLLHEKDLSFWCDPMGGSAKLCRVASVVNS